jgi:isopenicillin N synthase-like dioxygenase
MIIPQSTIDDLVLNLVQNGGVSTLNLPKTLADTNRKAFEIATLALDVASSTSSSGSTSCHIPKIEPKSNSAMVTGYHSAGGNNSLSRYNNHREGFVFSNGESFDIQLPVSVDDDNNDSNNDNNNNSKKNEGPSFEESMDDLFEVMCNEVAKNTLKGIARYLNLDNEDWFENAYGPMDKSSQWHVKRYVEPSTSINSKEGEKKEAEAESSRKGEKSNYDHDQEQKDKMENEEEEIEWLPVHTDPSLISIIIHDAPGYNQNAMGLQYQCPITTKENGDKNNNNNNSNNDGSQKKQRVWKEVEAHGHSVATIFCGSVMSYITGGLFPSAKHRVIYTKSQMQTQKQNDSDKYIDNNGGGLSSKKYRQAATLFLRPRGKSILTVPPCKILTERTVKIRKGLHFVDWLNRVSKNYQHKQKQQQQKQKRGGKIETQKKKHDETNNNDPSYWADEHTELTLHESTPALYGKEKYLGGELCENNGHIYTIPGFAGRVLDMDTTKEPPVLKLIGPELRGEFKWLRGIPIGDTIYGIPCHSGSVLKINALTNDIELLTWDESLPGAAPHTQKWKYHGAAVSDYDGCIYCIPQAAEHVLKINPETDEMSFIGPAFEGVNKWYGGLLLKDGAIYGTCQNATGILRIDPRTQSCTVHGNFPQGHWKWHGAVRHPNGNLYCIPAHADTVLKVEPGLEPKLSLLGSNLRTGEHRSDGKYKFLGGAVGGDCVYFFPSDTDYVLEVNTVTDQVREVGPNLRNLEPMRCNKWQNGFTAIDGTIYGIPLKGHTVLRIIPNAEKGEPDITTIGGPYTGLNKWEGGVTAANGDMYCVPLNHKCSLRIRPLKASKST